MKFDKETIIVLLAAALIFVGWAVFYPKYQNSQAEERARVEAEIRANERAKAESAAKNTESEPAKTAVPVQVADAPAKTEPVKTAVPETPAKTEETPAEAGTPRAALPETLENDLVKFSFATDGTVYSVEFKKFKKEAKSDTAMAICPEGRELPTFRTGRFEAPGKLVTHKKDESGALTIERQLDGFTIFHRYSLSPDSYQLKAEYEIRNDSGKDAVIPELIFWIAGMPPMHYFGDRVNTTRQNVDFCLDRKKSVESVEPKPDDPEKLTKKETSDAVAWAGSSNKYFASLLFPEKNVFDGGVKFTQTVVKQNGEKYAIPSVGGVFKNVSVRAGSSQSFHFLYYCGPKELKEFDQLPDAAMDVMHIAYWSWFEFIARPLVRFLVWLHSLVGNYGIAIILLTLIVRLVFWPVTQKANLSMRKMQKIQPKLKELREKYKSNPQEMNMRMMELYKQEGVNPLGGCLPVLLQLPVFFALYSALDSAVELRHVPFLWAADLTKPDAIFGWTVNLPLLGEVGIHPWILIMTALMVVQQKMTPAQGDPMQQKMMMAMPVIMLVMLYKLPSGLTLYWAVSQLFSIIQMKYSQYAAEKDEAKEKASGGGNKQHSAKAK